MELAWRPFCDDDALTWREKYVQSLIDSKRQVIRTDELTRFTWGFRFKAAAGEFFATLDPYWNSFIRPTSQDDEQYCMRRRFLANGAYASPDPPDMLQSYLQEHNIDITWRINKSRLGKRGQFIQLNRWPSVEVVRRTDDWGWTMHNQWVVYCAPAGKMRDIHDRVEDDVERFFGA